MDYKTTLNLPTTTFPMKGNLPVRELEAIARWDEEGLYEKIRVAVNGRPLYILHDGPPYANGHLHLGHAVNKVLKDIIVKAKTMQGYDAPFLPGWDCHGLPIEHQVLKDLGGKRKELTNQKIREMCRDYAEKYVHLQRDEFMRLGVWGDWENPYVTMAPDYEANILRELAKFVDRGMVYRGKRPVFWCNSCETALAEAEVEYDSHVSPSIYVKFLMLDVPDWLTSVVGNRKVSFVIWTTTPWTLVANQAICLHPDFDYAIVNVGESESWIIATECVSLVASALNLPDLRAVSIHVGKSFEGFMCRHPLRASSGDESGKCKSSVVILGRHVTLDQGTGCVHTAPGHGQEDYDVGKQYGLEPWAPVDHMGRFTSDIPDEVSFLVSSRVFDTNERIISALCERETLVHADTIEHSYPHCWRCKKPIIFRATEQWFVAMEKNQLRPKALEQVKKVQWIPPWGQDRMSGTIEARPDWCLSRQRVWGVPIPAFKCVVCHETVLESRYINHVADLVSKEGSGIWFTQPVATFLPDTLECPNPNCGESRWELTADILDVWFESGVTHAAVLKPREHWWPADLYLEGSDQHRGWFQSSLLSGIVADDQAPYRAVLTHGFVVDGEGKKMSKSARNVISPQKVIKEYGSEILRLWIAAQNYREDIRISSDILKQQADAYRKIRNTFRFMLGNISDFALNTDRVPYSQLFDIDRWALLRLHECIDRVIRAYDEFEFHMIFHRVNQFFVVDLSAIYFDVIKDRLYTFGSASSERRAAQTVIYEILTAVMRLLAPILPFTTDEVERALPNRLRQNPGIFLSGFPEVCAEYQDQELSKRWDRLLEIRSEVAGKLEDARRNHIIGSPLEAKVMLYADFQLMEFLNKCFQELIPLFIVSQLKILPMSLCPVTVPVVALVHSDSDKVLKIGIEVARADGIKCVRCWMYHPVLGSNANHPELCDRCVDAIVMCAETNA
mgnify:CR=1 FL=1|tara:strand:- start:829 stop:3705 length:2877 start_codon:yes stop_codon:yes gene_type:complete